MKELTKSVPSTVDYSDASEISFSQNLKGG
jgi:hypothetical protein